jgi:recombination protein RecT
MGNELQAQGVIGMLKSDAAKKRLDEVLGKKATQFISSIIAAVNVNPSLKNCDPESVINSAMVAASIDLPINQSLGFAHLVPYNNVVQFQIGWRGLVQLAMRTGQYAALNVSDVCDGELVKTNKFTGEIKFDQERKTSDTVVGYVAFFRLVNGFEKWCYRTVEQVRAHGAKYSKSYGSEKGKWKLEFDAMAKKTVLKILLSKWGIMSTEMQKAVTFDQAAVDQEGNPLYMDNGDGSASPRPIKRGRHTKNEQAEVVPKNETERRQQVIEKIEKLLIGRENATKAAMEREGLPFAEWKKADTDMLATVLAKCGGVE